MIWKWTLPSNESVEYSVNVWSGSETLSIDGEGHKIKGSLTGRKHEITLKNGKTMTLLTKLNFGLAPGVHVFLENQEIPPTNGPAKRHFPGWAWMFAAACMTIPVITVGGAIPAGIGGVSGLGCLFVSRTLGISTLMRVIFCVLITAVAWGLFLGLRLSLISYSISKLLIQ